MSRGRFFEDFHLGETIRHAVPRTLTQGERALYHALYPARHALASSDTFAAECGLEPAPLDEWIVFHTVFGKTVPDISLNAVANLGYAEGRWLAPVHPGDTLRAESEVIGLRQNSNGRSGVVYVRTTGLNQRDDRVLSYVRWVMVRRREEGGEAPEPVVPKLAPAVLPADLVLPWGLDFDDYDFEMAGDTRRWADYAVGEVVDHADAVTVEEAEHMMATRLWQNTARVHFDAGSRPDGRRLVYGGHVVSLARALSFNGLANAQPVLALNAGSHVAPCFAGDTVTAWSEVLDRAELDAPGAGALRLRLVAARAGTEPGPVLGEDGRYRDGVLLDLDIWAACPV
ncbi:MaoC family dehydratase [Roseitranquillus sediminis]|uniref:MaoC family dehydratase n=1 Tax=Roseitranquillus sediminis TaxID=2809051 RepID=UPI001D0BF505|nr:MaoC family dehydratase [Roseitranquillus sediminis]MBM9594817.1 MaoC family dehydratase [Roseitranquillus sediminis]